MILRQWRVGDIHQSPAETVAAMMISVDVEGSGYFLTIRTTDGAEWEFELRPDLAKSLAEGLTAALREYGNIETAPRTTEH